MKKRKNIQKKGKESKKRIKKHTLNIYYIMGKKSIKSPDIPDIDILLSY